MTLDEPGPVQIGQHAADRGQRQAQARSQFADRDRADEAWLDADVKVNRADFGLTWNQMGMASMNNTITIHAVFTKRG